MYHYFYAISLNTRSPPDKSLPWLLDVGNHCIILGKSGTGKSNYLRLILNLLDRKEGNIVLIDPHGKVSDFALKHSSKKIIFLSGRDYPGSEEIHTGINALQYSGKPEEAHLVADWLRQSFYMEDNATQGTWGARLTQVFSTILVGCMLQEPDLTLERFAEILANPAEVLSYFPEDTDVTVRKYVQAQNSYKSHWSDFISSTMNRLLPLVRNPLIQRVISMPQQDSVDLDSAIRNENHIIIPDVDQGLIGSDAVRVITTIILYRMWNVLINRGSSDYKTYVIVDEAQLIPSGILSTLLSQGRKYGVVLILSFQDLNALDRKLMSSLLSNVQNFACFRLSYDVADIMSRNMSPENRRRVLLDVLMKQNIHDATIFSGTGEELYGPVTVSPPFQDDDTSIEEISGIKAETAVRVSRMPRASRAAGLKIPLSHDRLKYSFASFLRKSGVNVRVEDKIEEKVPDITIYYSRRKVYCEVEDSDLKISSKIAEKMRNYTDNPLIFLCRHEDFNALITVIRNIMDMAGKGKNYRRSSLKLSKKDAPTELLNLSLVTYKEGKFLFFDGIKMIEFASWMLGEESSVMRRVKSLPLPELREAVLREIVDRYSEGKNLDWESMEEKLGRDRFRELLTNLRERGYAQLLDVNSIVELDKIDFR